MEADNTFHTDQICSFTPFYSHVCGPSKFFPSECNLVPISKCLKNISSHLNHFNLSNSHINSNWGAFVMFPSGHIFLQVHGTLYYMPKAACTVRSHVATGKHVRVPKSHRKGKTREVHLAFNVIFFTCQQRRPRTCWIRQVTS